MQERRFAAIVSTPSYKKVADAIEHQILSGSLGAGDLLPTESDLAMQLGVHRSTVREGIRSLENAGLIRRTSGKRLMVCVPTHGDVAWSTTRALGLGKVTFLELWEVQMNIEPFASRLAAQRVTPALAEALKANVARTEAALDDDAAIIDLDIEFHRLIAEGTQNQALLLSAKPISIMLFSATLQLYQRSPAARHRLLAAHRHIFAAIAAGDAATAELWMTKHIVDFRRGYDVAGMDTTSPIEFDPQALKK